MIRYIESESQSMRTHKRCGGFGRAMRAERAREWDMAGGPGRRHGRAGGRRGGGRPFDHGGLRWALLALIAEKPSHGYELIKTIEARLAGAYAPSPGVVYPNLTLLEEMGALSAVTEGGKKLYAITEEGRALLAENAEAAAATQAGMARFAAHARRPARIQEAIGALRAAVHARLEDETTLAPEQAEAIADILHRAAEGVSRA